MSLYPSLEDMKVDQMAQAQVFVAFWLQYYDDFKIASWCAARFFFLVSLVQKIFILQQIQGSNDYMLDLKRTECSVP